MLLTATAGSRAAASDSGPTAAPDSEALSMPGGFDKGCSSGEILAALDGATGGRRGKTAGGSVVPPDAGSGEFLGGKRRTGTAGVRDDGLSAFGGTTIPTVSLFGSVINGGVSDRENRTNIRRLSLLNS
jgi:hypothetical protein